MAVRTPETFAPDLVRLAEIARALGHPGRLQILRILADCNACICGDIVERLPLAQATVSQHLRALRQVGLIRGEIDGPRTCYCLDQETLAEAFAALGRLFAGIGCCRPAPSDINPEETT